MAQGSTVSTADPWNAALAAALIGAERAPAQAPAIASLPLPVTGDSGGDLLARVGALGAYRLAGAGLAADALVPFAPLEAAGPLCPPAAATRLAALIADTGAGGHVAEWLASAAERGVRAPPELLVALDLRRGTAVEADLIDRVADAELAWLKRVWTGEEAPAAASDDWTVGDAKARLAAFAAWRLHDADAARAAVDAVFRSEKAEMRAGLVQAFRQGLAPADEPFLEACLDDRAGSVREAAQALLPHLPDSRFAQRMARRAQAAIQVKETRRLLRSTLQELVVTLPEAAPDLARDGVEPPTYARGAGGPRAQMLRQIVALAPLSAHAGRPPRLWIELALRSEWAVEIVSGFVRALRRERDPAWTSAAIAVLRDACAHRLSGVKPGDDTRTAMASVIGTLPPQDWERMVAEALKGPADLALTILTHAPARLSAAFSAALLDWLSLLTRAPASDRETLARSGLIRRIGANLDPSADSAAAAAAIAARLPDGAEDDLRRQLAALAETLDLRTAMRREFDPT